MPKAPSPPPNRLSEEQIGFPKDPLDYDPRVGTVAEAEIATMQRQISKLLKFSTFEPEQRYWLDTGYEQLNATLGSRKRGLPYGKIYELSGIEHGGKTVMGTVLAGIAQKDGAAVGYIDLEDSRDEKWAVKLGLNYPDTLPVYPKLVEEGKKTKTIRLQSAEEIFAEAEVAMQLFAKRGYKKQYWLLDSVANIQTAMAVEAGLLDRNMRVNMDRAMFLSNVLPRWAGLASNYGAMIVLVNQLRNKVGMVFGDPLYAPGGRALAHACAIRARVRRLKNGQIRQNGKVVGIIGVIKNTKNKAGEGSVEQEQVCFKIKWSKSPARIEFMSVEEAEEE
jgi:recombination protein RecA